MAILRSANSAPPDPRLESVLAAFRAHWLGFGRRRYPQLADDLEDVIQNALMKLVSRDKLATLHEPSQFEAWARRVFVRAGLDLIRDSKRYRQQRAYFTPPTERPTPEDLASHHERLAIVARVAGRLEIARLKFVEDLPEKEIARRQHLTRLGVASQLKRLRQSLRQALDGIPARSGPSTGLSTRMASAGSPRPGRPPTRNP